MRNLAKIGWSVGAALLIAAPVDAQEAAHDHEHGDAPEGWVPEAVDMAASASEEARLHLNRGVEALHNFWYDAARVSFRSAQEIEPDFVLAYWGEAFSFHYPFGFTGGEPDSIRAVLNRLAPSATARAALASTERERAFLDAIEVLASDGTEQERRRGFAQGMKRLAEAYPDDEEALAFYSISLFGTETNIRGFPMVREEAARAAMKVLRTSPKHPGALHYAIHALDTPETAAQVEELAERYVTVAHTAPHAIHMPSHIFLQVARWDDAIEANTNAFEASEEWVKQNDLPLHRRDYHAVTFMHYALLQQGRFKEARAWVEQMRALREESDHWSSKWYDAVWSAVERIEMENWGSSPLPTSGFAGRDELLAAAIDAAMTGQLDSARSVVATMREKLEASRGSGSAARPAPRWQVAVSEMEALIAAREGRLADARAAIALALDAYFELPPPNETPDPPKPPYELLGDILLEAGEAEGAVDAYRRSLELRRDRARSLVGLARAARSAGDTATAAEAYERLLTQWNKADPDRPELTEAQTFLVRAATPGAPISVD